MICPECSTENIESAKFCMNCGQPLERACPNCGKPVPDGARFCPHCGETLPTYEAPPRTVQGSFQQYIPKELLQKLKASHGMAGERRTVTVLFCDVKGSTAAAEDLDPEDWAEIMNGAFKHLIAPVYRYEGTLARLMGDAILAFFGAPIAHEDDPERALLAALDIIDEIKPYCGEVRTQWGIDFNVRIGINTGLVVVGEVGSDLRVEYTAMGDAVNLASRMEQSAEPGTILISEYTYQRVAPLFEFEPLGEIAVKGKEEKVPAYRVLDRKVSPGRIRGIEGLDSPLVGRTREMGELFSALGDLERGFGAVMCLIGEAGLGKSRLIEEVRAQWLGTASGNGKFWGICRGVSYESAHPYGQINQLLRTLFEIGETEAPESACDKIADCLERHNIQRSPLVFERMLGLTGSDEDHTLEGEAFKREVYDASLDLWGSIAAAQPTAIVIDDLHWGDQASAELILHLLQLTNSRPILFLCAFRPDRSAPSWRVKQTSESEYPHRYKEIVLQPLSAAESQTLVDHLLTVAELPPQVHRAILEKAEGNPFFLEEVIRSLIDSGMVVRDQETGHWVAASSTEGIDIPSNLQALLLARMDRLEEAVRRTLQLASVIGRSFYYRVLQAINQAGGELDHHLNDLQRVEIIREVAHEPELEYIFRHALTQEAAYQSILRKERRAYHLRVAQTLEELYQDRLEELTPLLAHHYYESGNPRALDVLARAGESAFRMFALSEALEHYDKALEIESEDRNLLKQIYAQRGRTLELRADWYHALANYDAMEAKALELGDRPMELDSLVSRAVIHSTANRAADTEQAKVFQEKALFLAKELGDRGAEARVYWTMMLRNSRMGGDLTERIEFAHRSITLARELGMRELVAFTQHDLWFAYSGTGEWEVLIEGLKEAEGIWREQGNLPMLSETLTRISVSKMATGYLEEAVAISEEAYRVAVEAKNLDGQVISQSFIPIAYFELGRFDEAIAKTLKAIEIGDPIKNITSNTMIPAELGLAYGWFGLMDSALAYATQAYRSAEELYPPATAWSNAVMTRLYIAQGDLDQAQSFYVNLGDFQRLSEQYGFMPPFWSSVALARGEWAIATGDTAGALAHAKDYLALLESRGVRLYLPQAHHLIAAAELAGGHVDGALEALQRGLAEAESIGAIRAQLDLLILQTKALTQVDLLDAAEGARERAEQIAKSLGDQIENEALREAFFARTKEKLSVP